MSDSNQTATINVTIQMWMSESERIPKFIELFDKSLLAIRSFWVGTKSFTIDQLKKGTYTLRLSLSSGIQKDVTFDLSEGEAKNIDIDIANNSPHETHEWAYFNKSFSIESIRDTNLKDPSFYHSKGRNVEGKLWKYNNGSWQPEMLPQFPNTMIHEDGYTFTINTSQALSFLEVSGSDMPNLYVSLPPQSQLNCLARLAECPDMDCHPVDVTVSSENLEAETLLTLLTTGAIRKAKSLKNAQQAENLLYQKMVNPVSAAIGGYFLLKIGELERLHDWANNLANIFEWLPDGAIIHASQLLNQKKKTDTDINNIRRRLIEAVMRGLPVYTEGLRLLEKGLRQLWYHFEKSDVEINQALDRVGKYVEVADWNQETTTFIGISPGEPGRKHREIVPSELFQPEVS